MWASGPHMGSISVSKAEDKSTGIDHKVICYFCTRSPGLRKLVCKSPILNAYFIFSVSIVPNR